MGLMLKIAEKHPKNVGAAHHGTDRKGV